MFGNFTLKPPASTEKQVDDLKVAWSKTNQKSVKQAQQYKELVKFANALGDSYINSVKVIVDVSSLLNSYSELFDEISKGLSTLEENMDSGMRGQDIETLKNLTLVNIDNINNTFRSSYDRISKAIASTSSPAAGKALTNTRNSIGQLYTERLQSVLAGGNKKHLVRVDKKKVAHKPKAKKTGAKPKPKQK